MDQLRLDLNGIPLLAEEAGQVICLLRFRTREGLVLGLPEEGDIFVPWEEIAESVIDLRAGEVRLGFAAAAVARHAWLRGRRVLSGTWLDRQVRDADPRA